MTDKRSIARAMLEILRGKGHTADLDTPGGISMLEWLRKRKQTAGAIERFWRVVLVSALDEELDKTDAKFGLDVFWKGFLSNRTGYRMGVPAVPLAKLYDGCKLEIERRGGEVSLRMPVRAVHFQDGGVSGVEFDGRAARDGRRLRVRHSSRRFGGFVAGRGEAAGAVAGAFGEHQIFAHHRRTFLV